jgi:hypothetical protein
LVPPPLLFSLLSFAFLDLFSPGCLGGWEVVVAVIVGTGLMTLMTGRLLWRVMDWVRGS